MVLAEPDPPCARIPLRSLRSVRTGALGAGGRSARGEAAICFDENLHVFSTRPRSIIEFSPNLRGWVGLRPTSPQKREVCQRSVRFSVCHQVARQSKNTRRPGVPSRRELCGPPRSCSRPQGRSGLQAGRATELTSVGGRVLPIVTSAPGQRASTQLD